MFSIIELSSYISVIFFSLLLVFIIWFIFFFNKWADKNFIPVFGKIIGEPNKPVPVYDAPVPSTTREVLRNDCVNETKLRCFFFVNVPLITDLYSQIESQQPIKQIEKISTGKKQNIGGNLKLPIADAEASYDKINDQQVEIESCYLPSQSSYCKKVMKRLYEDNEVFILDIEERNYNPDIEKTFDRCCESLYNDCHAPLPEHWLKIYREQVKKYATSYEGLKNEIEETCQNKRYVITKGDFRLAENNRNVFIKNIGGDKIIIEIPFDPEKVSKDKLKILTEHKNGNFTVFGKIDRWDSDSSKLIIFPMAMY
jgi:hypothetical protein